MTAMGRMFDPDPDYTGCGEGELLSSAVDPAGSVVSRGRAILEVGRRAVDKPDLQELLFAWMSSSELASKRWFGLVTLAWISACCLGHSVRDENRRQRLAVALNAWPEHERETLLNWAKAEDWFDGIA
jgi:hypothetical protein